MSGPYDDMLHLPHPTSARHPRMPISERAAIFSPFAALTGHAGAIAETARLTDQKMEAAGGSAGAYCGTAGNHGYLVPAG